ncbi:MAG TPA: cytochrome P450 [Kofleriaceae bacterium]|nr:cytochrome P450 [Kofleriaceae bacterium]
MATTARSNGVAAMSAGVVLRGLRKIQPRRDLPPGPQSPPLVQLARWVLRPIQLLEECQREFGDVFTWGGFREGDFVIVADPDMIKQVFSADPETLLAGVGNAVLLEPLLGKNSLLTLDRAEHLRQRRLLLPSFHGERMQAYSSTMRAITSEAVDRWPVGKDFALHSEMQAITLDVILRTVFGIDQASKHGGLRAQLIDLLEILSNPWLMFPGLLGFNPFTVPWLRVAKLKKSVDDLLYRIIAERRAAPRGTDVLSMMLDAKDDKGEPMSDVEIRDELVTLLLAGHETTATSLAWVFDQLLTHPAVMTRLREDVAAGKDEYLDAVIRETLRIRPIIPLVGRVVAKPFQMGPWHLPVGTRIAPSIYLSGMRAASHPEPKRFNPDRWLGVKPDPYTWLPFGGGIRRCIGMAFAQLEMKIVVQTIVQRTRMRAVGGEASVVRRGITLAPSEGRRVVIGA